MESSKALIPIASYSDIQDEKWPEVQQWLQKRLDSTRKCKGIEQQGIPFDQSE